MPKTGPTQKPGPTVPSWIAFVEDNRCMTDSPGY